MATFITSKTVGQTINITVNTSTGYWKYNHNGSNSSVFSNGSSKMTVANANGEFTIIPCNGAGTVDGNLTVLQSNHNQLTSFDGTGLSGLTNLILMGNQLTTFDGTGLVSLATLVLNNNQLTSFNGTGLSSLTELILNDNHLTTLDITGLSSLNGLGLDNNPILPRSWDSILSTLVGIGNSEGTLSVDGAQRTESSDGDYDILTEDRMWTIYGTFEIVIPPTFITSRTVGQWVNITVQTSTGYWKYNHDGTDSSVFSNGSQTITVANANGEFTIIPCLSNGTVSGDLTVLYSNNNQLTSFDGTGLSGLTNLRLMGNQLTSFDGTGLSGLTTLRLMGNQLTSFDGTGLSGLTNLDLYGNQLTSFDGTGLSSLTVLNLGGSQLTSFDGTGLSGLIGLNLGGNQLTSFDETGLSGLTGLNLSSNQLTSFDTTGLSGLTELYLSSNQLTSLDITGLNILQYLYVQNNQLTPSVNNSLLAQLAANELANDWDSGEFYTTGGRTFAGTTDYDYLIANSWDVQGVDLYIPPTFITAKLTGETINIYVLTSTGYWKYNHNETDSSVFSNGSQTATVANANGEFTIISCLSDGTVSGDIINLYLDNNQLTSFDGTGLSSLTNLELYDNQLTSFDGTGLSGLINLHLTNNQLTSFDGTGLSGLTYLDLSTNQLTSFDTTDLSSLIELYIGNNPIPALVNNQILADLVNNGISGGYLDIDGSPNLVRTTASNDNFTFLTMDLAWTVNGTYSFPSSGLGKLRVKGIRIIDNSINSFVEDDYLSDYLD